MAERIVSPGVFTNEIDQSFLPAAVSDIGAALVGICSKGPAFVPTVVENFADFKIKFGDLDPENYLPYTAQNYLRNSGTATIVRVLGTGGYTATKPILISLAGAFEGSASIAAFGLTQQMSASVSGSTKIVTLLVSEQPLEFEPITR